MERESLEESVGQELTGRCDGGGSKDSEWDRRWGAETHGDEGYVSPTINPVDLAGKAVTLGSVGVDGPCGPVQWNVMPVRVEAEESLDGCDLSVECGVGSTVQGVVGVDVLASVVQSNEGEVSRIGNGEECVVIVGREYVG